MKLSSAIFAGLIGVAGLAGCGGGGSGTVVVTPTATITDNFFATWEIDSLQFGNLDCASAGASSVDMDIVNVDSGQRFVYSFPCAAYQGTSGAVDVGHFDVLLNLTDAGGGVIDQINVGTENVSTAGTIDLGHFQFRLP